MKDKINLSIAREKQLKIVAAEEKGMAKGLAEGIKKGRAEGSEKAAINMLKKDFDLQTIKECTGLLMKQLKKLKKIWKDEMFHKDAYLTFL